jgi:hypothetical protein
MKETRNKTLQKQVKKELNKTFNINQFIIWGAIILVLPTLQFFLIKDNYVFYRQLDLFLRMNSGFIAILFPILIVLINPLNFVKEQKNQFIQYTRTRISLPNYILAKLISNGILTFSIAFLMVFIPFIFSMYIEPLFGFVQLYPTEGSPIPHTTFEQFLPLGTLVYGLIYSTWIGINGALYGTIILLLVILIDRDFIALSITFIVYMIFNFMAQLFDFDKFSPMATLFPFTISQQQLWTVLIPFTFAVAIMFGTIIYLKRNLYERYE